MKQAEMAHNLAQHFGSNLHHANQGLNDLFAGIGETLARGEAVRLPGLGVLTVGARKGGTGRNPRTGETIQIAPGHRVKFTAHKALKDRLALVPVKQVAE